MDTPTQRVVIIAECCQNHNGDQSLLMDMVREAAAAGADYVKFQAIDSRDLVFRQRFEVPDSGAIVRPFAAELQRLQGLDLPPGAAASFVAACREAGVRSMVTPFTMGSVERLAEVGFDAVKIASYDCANLPLVAAAGSLWEEVFLSTGAMELSEVADAVGVLRENQISALHCVSVYPTPIEQANLGRMDSLMTIVDRVGLSDHSSPAESGLLVSMVAIAMGARVIERHFTVLDPRATKDGQVSVNPRELSELREFANQPQQARLRLLDQRYPDWRDVAEQGASVVPSDGELRNRDYFAGRFATQPTLDP